MDGTAAATKKTAADLAVTSTKAILDAANKTYAAAKIAKATAETDAAKASTAADIAATAAQAALTKSEADKAAAEKAYASASANADV